MNWETKVLEILAASLVRPLTLAGAALVTIRAFRIEHPASKSAVWRAALIGTAILPFAASLAPPIEFAFFPEGSISRVESVWLRSFETPSSNVKTAQTTPPEGNSHAPTAAAQGAAEAQAFGGSPSAASPLVRPVAAASPLTAQRVLLCVYFAGLGAFSLYRIVGWVLMRRLVARSRALNRSLRQSGDIVVPVAVGVWRPTVLIPDEWRQWDRTARLAAAAHEFEHIRRRDAWTLSLSRWATCLFWYHPLVWWIARHVSELAEMACDAKALQRVRDPKRYSTILLEFTAAVSRRGYHAGTAGLAVAGSSPIARRIDHIFTISNRALRRLPRPAAVLTVIGVPVLACVATLRITEITAKPLAGIEAIVSEQLGATPHQERQVMIRSLLADLAEAARISVADQSSTGFDPSGFYRVVQDLATFQARAGDKTGVRTTIQAAVAAGKKLDYGRVNWSCGMARYLVRVGDKAGALAVCRDAMAEATATRGKVSYSPPEGSAIAVTLAYAGDLAGARTMANTFSRENRRAAYEDIVIILASVEDGRIVNLPAAREFAGEITSAEGRSGALSFIAVGQAKSGDAAGSAVTFGQAKAQAASIADPTLRGTALGQVARRQAEVGDLAGAREIDGDAVEGAIVLSLARSGDLAGAEAALATIADARTRDRYRESSLAPALAAAGRLTEVKAIGAQIEGTAERDRFYLRLVEINARDGKLTAVQSLVGEITGSANKDRANAAIVDAQARALADAGDFPGALAAASGLLPADPFRGAYASLIAARARVGDKAGLDLMRKLFPTERAADFDIVALRELLPGNDFIIRLGRQ